ncbi:MAG: NPCBM/NEW2 domain-containing protein [Candidatus Hydrogenedentes bacterium]|nr:NPCBM/NEW2 domain-containing protein [Candidatus Hydrogenedentota bacterium]
MTRGIDRLWLLGFIAVLLTVAVMPAWCDPAEKYLGDLLDDAVVSVQMGWGGLGVDTAVRPLDGRAASPLRIKDTTYDKGLGHHAPGEIVVDLNGEYDTFIADVGIQFQQNSAGSVTFQVFVDGQKQFDSGVMKEQDEAKHVEVPCSGAYELRLVTTDAGDGITCDCANWANARLVPSATKADAKIKEPIDIAPFARVIACDPHRTEGTSAKRTEEFPADDLKLESPISAVNGTYTAAVFGDLACIGLQWAEPRVIREIGVEWGAAPSPVDAAKIRAEYWSGESPWQGAWKPLQGTAVVEGSAVSLKIRQKDNPDYPVNGIDKIRWIVPAALASNPITKLNAYSRGHWTTASIRLEYDGPSATHPASVEAYNGWLVNAEGQPAAKSEWSPGSPVVLTVRYSNAFGLKTNRTVLRVRGPRGDTGIAVADVLERGPVFVRDLGLFAIKAEDATTLSKYAARVAANKTVLERVRTMPDQTLEQALAVTHNPIQNLGPMLISLACDNRKVVIEREGVIQYQPRGASPDKNSALVPSHHIGFQFGAKPDKARDRRLVGSWLPAPMSTFADGDVLYHQTTCVIPGGESVASAPNWIFTKPLCVSRIEIENTGSAAASAQLSFGGRAGKTPHAVNAVPEGAIAAIDGATYFFADFRGAAPLTSTVSSDSVSLTGSLNAGQKATVTVTIPLWDLPADAYLQASAPGDCFEPLRAYWAKVLEGSIEIATPDLLMNDILRAARVHCLMAARSEEDGKRVAAWIASDRYGPLESEAHSVILGMDLMGHDAFAQRSLDYFIARYNNAGFLTTGYTVVGTGQHLWTLARHAWLSGDTEWIRSVANEVARVDKWIVAQRAKTRALGGNTNENPEFGFVPPGVGADWNRYGYRYSLQAQYYAGLHDTAEVLASVSHPDAQTLLDDATAFRDDITRAYRWNQARTPAVSLSTGVYVPGYSGMLYAFGPTGDVFPGEDGNRSWCYDIELGSHHLVPLGVFPADGPDADWIMDHMEDVMFLESGMGDYPREKNHSDWFNYGGFAKVQPYYARNAEICALRDDVKPFIRSYFNALAAQLSLENLSHWEHFHNIAAWNKTHETGWFLVQSRTMFVAERGDELWLAPFITDRWLEDGKTVSVRNAPTQFGPVSYRIESHVRKGYIDFEIDPPSRKAPSQIAIRLRHPDGKSMSRIKTDSKTSATIDPDTETVRITKWGAPTKMRVYF